MSLGRLEQLWDLTLALVRRDLKVRYRRSVLGFLWTMLQPLMTMAVMTVVFSSVFRFALENYAVYALAGILFWSFFSQSVTHSMNSLKGYSTLLTQLPLPKAIFPTVAVLSGTVNFFLAMVPLLVLIIVTGHRITPAILFLPISIAIAATFTLGIGLMLSPLAVYFDDTVELVGVFLTIGMYLTPTFYPMSIVPERFLWLVRFNPIRSLLEVFRDPLYYGKVPPLSHFAVAMGVALTAVVIGAALFRRTSREIALRA